MGRSEVLTSVVVEWRS